MYGVKIMKTDRDIKRREFLQMIGATAGGFALYNSMIAFGVMNKSDFSGVPEISAAPKGATILVLGAGIAGLIAAYELKQAGYKVKILDYNNRVGGRAWTLRGGDEYTELGGFAQKCGFDKGLYINPGPWRIPHHHQAYLHYAQKFGVEMQPFQQFNQNAYLHNSQAFDGKPMRYREIFADFRGYTNELLAKSISQDQLDQSITKENKEMILEAVREWGGLDKNYRYAGRTPSSYRGWATPPGATHDGIPSTPLKFDDVLSSNLWSALNSHFDIEYSSTIFQPVGGMDMLPKAIAKQLNSEIQLNSKVTEIIQDDKGVTVTYTDMADGNKEKIEKADWCVCTIPFSVLAQIKNNLSEKVQEGIAAVHYNTGFKAGLQFKRRFWEEDEQIYGGITYTDLKIGQISYPSSDFFSKGKGVVLGSYLFGINSLDMSARSPEDRLQRVLDDFQKIHPQAKDEFDNGISVAWHRHPGSLGCHGIWTEATREKYFKDISTMDNRIVLAGEHVSYIPAWQEGSILSTLEAIRQLNERASKQ